VKGEHDGEVSALTALPVLLSLNLERPLNYGENRLGGSEG